MKCSSEMRGDQVGGAGGRASLVKMIRIRQLIELVPVSRATVYDWMNPSSPRYDPTFPRPIRLSGSARNGAVGWTEISVINWIDARIESGRA